MQPRVLLGGPPVFVALFLVLGLATSATGALDVVLRVENEIAKLFCVGGCFAAALAFERGDYLRRAWALVGACMLLLVLRDATLLPGIDEALGGARFEAGRGAIVVAANTSSAIGTWLLARAWSVSGLDDEASRRRRWSLLAAGVVIALAATGWPLSLDVGKLAAGELNALAWVGSDLGDTICFALMAPVLATALALRGGRLLWPWALLTAGGFCWILYDAFWGMSEAWRVDGVPDVRVGVEAFRALAGLLTGVAGLAQRWAVGERA